MTAFHPEPMAQKPRILQHQRPALLDWRRARPMLLCNGIAPCRARLLEHEPSLREHASLDAVDLHAYQGARLAGVWISPLEREAEPRAACCCWPELARPRCFARDSEHACAGRLFQTDGLRAPAHRQIQWRSRGPDVRGLSPRRLSRSGGCAATEET